MSTSNPVFQILSDDPVLQSNVLEVSEYQKNSPWGPFASMADFSRHSETYPILNTYYCYP